MRLKRLHLVALLAASVSSAAAQGNEIPAEFPPSSFQGRQYVDSKGCVFVRAGIDGTVNWVPRVNRQRQQLCGAKPTFASAPEPEPDAPRVRQATVITPPPVTQADPAPVQAATPATAPARAPAPTAKPKPAPVRSAAATPAPMRTVASIQTPRPKPTPVQTVRAAPRPVVPRVVQAAPKPSVPPAPLTTYRSVEAACQTGATYVTRHSREGTLMRVRCAPQSPSHVTLVRRGEAPGAGKNVYYNRSQDARSVPGSTRIVPRQVYEKRDDQVVKVPEGYRGAFQDDRLNRNRANQSVDGYLQTQLVWTNTVPRRLVDRHSGRDVTAKYPKLIYPYTDYATQNAALSTRSKVQVPVKSRAVAKAAAPRSGVAAPQGRFVQVGTFGVPSNAQATGARLQQMGLPVTYSNFRKGGKSFRVVLAGPFSNGAQLDAALGSARRAGFGDAFVR